MFEIKILEKFSTSTTQKHVKSLVKLNHKNFFFEFLKNFKSFKNLLVFLLPIQIFFETIIF